MPAFYTLGHFFSGTKGINAGALALCIQNFDVDISKITELDKMRIRILGLSFSIILLACLQYAFAQEGRLPLDEVSLERRVNTLLKQMTLEEKIGQLNQLSAGEATGPESARANYGE